MNEMTCLSPVKSDRSIENVELNQSYDSTEVSVKEIFEKVSEINILQVCNVTFNHNSNCK